MPDEPMDFTYQMAICNKQRLEIYRCNESGLADEHRQLVGEAYRANVNSDWFVGIIMQGKMWNVGRVGTAIPEVMQRRMILGMLTAAFNMD